MFLPMLYSRTSTGNVQTWHVEIQEYCYRAITGLLEGKKITNEWTTCIGKNPGKSNETSGEEQALKEANAAWKKKVKEGYHESVDDIDNQTFIEPMLAKNYNDHADKVVFPIWSDKKYNGMRCLLTSKGMFSRKGEKIISAPHVFNFAKHLFKDHPNLVLDGELYDHNLRYELNELMKLVRKTKAKDITVAHLAKSKELVKYYVYDCWDFLDVTIDTNFSKRKDRLRPVIAGVQSLVFVETDLAHNQEELDDFYASYLEDGYEGQMLRFDAEYQQTRSANLLKRKPTDDSEFVIVDIKAGTGNWSDAAKIVDLIADDGKTFSAAVKGSKDLARKCLLEKESWIGKKVTITYNGLTGKNLVPNFAQFNPINCLKE